MNTFKSFIPNFFTLMNLFCGVLAILLQSLEVALILMLASLIFDVLDGLIARKLGVQSPLGVQLDSLADLISFGLMPAYFLFHLFHEPLGNFALIAGIIPVAGAYRLGKFNLLPPSKYFAGLPIPSAAFFVMSVALVSILDPIFFDQYLNTGVTLVLVVLFTCLSMLSSVKLISLKGKKKEIIRLVLILSPLLIASIFMPFLIILVIPAYFISGFFT